MSSHAALRSSVIITVSAGFVIVGAGAAAMPALLALGPGYAVKALVAFACAAALVARSALGGHPFPTFGPANTITTSRMAFVALVTALVGERASAGTATATIAIATGVTICDGLDGWLARRTAMASDFGAYFDMETDALLILALSVLTWQHGKAGAWIVLSGLLRYLFVTAGWVWPWMQRPLPPRFRRKTVCVVQIGGLLVALLPSVVPPASSMIAGVSLALLAWSFAVDTLWLWRARQVITLTTTDARAFSSSSRDTGA